MIQATGSQIIIRLLELAGIKTVAGIPGGSILPLYDERLGRRSCSVPLLEQYTLAEFIAGGDFERHLNRRRRRLAEGAVSPDTLTEIGI